MERIVLKRTKIDISGKTVVVDVIRNESGNIEINPVDKNIFSKGEYLENGHEVSGLETEIIISKHLPNN